MRAFQGDIMLPDNACRIHGRQVEGRRQQFFERIVTELYRGEIILSL
jgi:hypothetical protein